MGPPLAQLLLLPRAGTLRGVRRPVDGAGVGKGLGAEAPAVVVKSMTDALVRRREGEGLKPVGAAVAGEVPFVRPRPRLRALLRRAEGREGERPGRQRAERWERAVSLASHSGCGAGGKREERELYGLRFVFREDRTKGIGIVVGTELCTAQVREVEHCAVKWRLGRMAVHSIHDVTVWGMNAGARVVGASSIEQLMIAWQIPPD